MVVFYGQSKTVKNDWIKFTKTSRYFDRRQLKIWLRNIAILNLENIVILVGGGLHNLQHHLDIISNVSSKNNKIMYKNKQNFTHFHEKKMNMDFLIV